MAKPKARILLVDDSTETLEVLGRNLSAAGYGVTAADSVANAVDILTRSNFDLVVTDLKMPEVSGLELVRHVRENYPDTAVIMITGYASIETAVSAVREGAEDYLPKPFTDDELFAVVDRALSKLQARRHAHAAEASEAPEVPGLVGESDAMRTALRAVAKAASTSATVLITGESGTGKELFARAIHYTGERASAPFVPVNCAGIPEGLVESELFGHVKGAFTGAVTTRAGFFIAADGGTIFLDEISELPITLQAKLLRVLEDHQVQMVGASKLRPVDVRVITATNQDLLKLVEKGGFRDDLYFRLNVVTLNVPPLRERGDDLLLLTRHFSDKFAKQLGKPVPHFTDNALRALHDHRWPGNVRELENLIQRLMIMADDDEIDVADLPAVMRFSVSSGSDVNRTLAEVEAEHIRNVLESVDGNKSRAAQILDIDRKTLREKLKGHAPDKS